MTTFARLTPEECAWAKENAKRLCDAQWTNEAADAISADARTRFPGREFPYHAMLAAALFGASVDELANAALDAFDSATLQDVVDGKAERLPLDLRVNPVTQALASEILKEREALPTPEGAPTHGT
jgi:hypothetical protein